MTQYEVVNPLFVSFLPLALYVAFRQYVRTDVALLGAAIFAFAHPFYYQYPTAGRAATPVIFLALFGVALSNKELSSGSRAALAVAFLSGIVVTHYGTSYYVAAALVIAFVLVAALRFVDSVAGEYLQRVAPVSDGGTTARGRAPTLNRSSIFSLSTVLFFISAALGWYLYMRQGWKFSLLPKHIFDNLMTLVRGSAGGGRTAARVQESYTSPSIQISKYIYILVAVLIAVGLAVVYYRRIVTRESSFDDHYLAIGTGLFGIFATTLILSNWGGGRPMMVTFSFTTVFAAVGAMWVADVGKRIATVAGRKVPSVATEGHTLEGRPIGATVFAVILLAFFVLNSGVAAATVFDGLAPSNVPAQSDLVTSDGPQRQVTVHRETDIVTHVWLVRHLDDRYDVYGDTYGARQYDWYRPDVAARTPSIGGGYTSATKPGVLSVDAQRAGTQPGYILVMGHNLELQAVWPGKFVSGTSLDELSLSRRNRIYSTGESHVYFYATADQPTAEDSDPSSEG